MHRRELLSSIILLLLLRGKVSMGKDIDVLGCKLKGDRLYRVEPHRHLFQWVKDEGKGVYSVGMTSLLASLSYPIYSIRIKPVGTELEFDDNLAVVESGKRIATFPTPLSGEIVQINEVLLNKPEVLNEKPYTHWIAKIKIKDTEDLKPLKRAEEIEKVVKEVIIAEDIDCSKIKD